MKLDNFEPIPLKEIKENKTVNSILNLSLSKIRANPDQPRKYFNEVSLKELSDSIKREGVLQPILVTLLETDKYKIVAGERRWRAAALAGLTEIPAILKSADKFKNHAVALIENIQREDLNPIEEAAALKRLIEEFEMTHEQVAESVGRSRAMVTNMLRLLNLSSEVQQKLIEKKIKILTLSLLY